VKITWFPANATSVLQSMDVGVIYAFKLQYRRFLIQSLILNVEEANSSYALARSVSLLDAVNWIKLAVKKIKTKTVKSVLLKLGLGKVMWQIIWSDNIAAICNLCRGKELSCYTNDFVQSDDHLATSALNLLQLY
jgi:hypothetical protein